MRQGVLEQVSISGFHSAILSLILGVSFFFQLPICWLVLKGHPENLLLDIPFGPLSSPNPKEKRHTSHLPHIAIARAFAPGLPFLLCSLPLVPSIFLRLQTHETPYALVAQGLRVRFEPFEGRVRGVQGGWRCGSGSRASQGVLRCLQRTMRCRLGSLSSK